MKPRDLMRTHSGFKDMVETHGAIGLQALRLAVAGRALYFKLNRQVNRYDLSKRNLYKLHAGAGVA